MRNALRPLRAAARLAAAWAPVLMVEAMLLAGPVAIAYGAWLASPPAGYIVAGVEMIAIAWILAKRSA